MTRVGEGIKPIKDMIIVLYIMPFIPRCDIMIGILMLLLIKKVNKIR